MTDVNTTIFFWFNSFAGRSEFSDFLITFFANYLAYILIIAFVLIVLLSKSSRAEKFKIAISAFIVGLVGRLLIVESIRYFYHHPRPFVALIEARQLFPETGYSFPSGHATFFFGLSAVLYCFNKKAGKIFFVLSVFMGFTRIMAGVHYPLDILGGAILGTFIGFGSYALLQHFDKKSVAEVPLA